MANINTDSISQAQRQDSQEGFSNHPRLMTDAKLQPTSWYESAFATVTRTAKANPWLTVGALGLGAAAIGYYFATRNRANSVVSYTYEEEVDFE